LYPPIQLHLPSWVADEIGDPERSYPTIEARMALAIRLSTRNIQEGGGPFGAAIFEIETGKLIAPGINLVVPLHSSLAHAEAMAIMMAQTVLGTHDLSAPGLPPMELVTSAQPCIQCYGNLWWSGLRRLVVGATKEDVESLTGFAEGPVPQDWAEVLAHRPPLQPIAVIRDVLRAEAREVLAAYRNQNGTIYNPE
jgi:tRNA(Arg) A34 adenosine deaminase TadA